MCSRCFNPHFFSWRVNTETTDVPVPLQKKKALVIDDDGSVRRCLTMILRCDHEVHAAEDVDSGLEIFDREQPDIILIDYMMPGKTGIEGIQLIRKRNPHVPIILVSGNVDTNLQKEAISAGANLFVEKPFNLAELSAAVHRLASANAEAA